MVPWPPSEDRGFAASEIAILEVTRFAALGCILCTVTAIVVEAGLTLTTGADPEAGWVLPASNCAATLGNWQPILTPAWPAARGTA